MNMCLNRNFGCWLAWLAWPWLAGADPIATDLRFNRDIRPILSENCFSCHGTDSATRKAGLRLDQPQSATNKLENGSVAIVPGQPGQSELIRRIFLEDDDQMPPAKVNKVLTPMQKERLKKWIATGAQYEPHWAFVPPQKTTLPQVKNTGWVRNPVDHFILARLEAEHLSPNREADKHTLIRRVTLDLTGLPPEPAAVAAFVADRSPGAYEKVVDRLLASPQWGEHRARYWLDVARYGDTHGIHYDNYREMWSYREWVIKAFNRNLPFDQFTIENLAGDLLPNATRDQQIGSGFNRCNTTSNEGGLINEEYYVLYARDRTETTAQTWLGLTAGCAVCHDHKYDPMTQKDFYSLSAFFNNLTMKAMDGNIKDTPPVIVVPRPEDDARWQKLGSEIPASAQKIVARKNSARGDFTNWLAESYHPGLSGEPALARQVFAAPLDEGAGTDLHFELAGVNHLVPLGVNTNWLAGAVAAQAYQISGSAPPVFAAVGDFERTNAFSYSVWLRVTDDKSGSFFARMADRDQTFRGWDLWLEGGKPTLHLIHEWPKNALKVAGKQSLPRDRWSHVCVTYNGSSRAKGVRIYVDGELQEMEVLSDNLKDTTRTTVPFKLGQRDSTSPMAGAGLQDLRVFARELKREEVGELAHWPRLQWLALKPVRTSGETDELFGLWLNRVDRGYRDLLLADRSLLQEEKAIRARGTVAYVMNERTNAPEAYVLFRGAYDQRRDPVTANTPGFLPPMPAGAPANRLGFARWLLQPQNPLTARVTVNRFWQELFGTGLVKTAGDFGVAGEPPSHPELLDWLAVDFRENHWDVKRFFKLLVLSATYRQSAVASPEKLEKDPENRLLARGPRFRMDAEMVRDYALAASGLLTDRIGGPSVRPYQPPGIWDKVGMPGGDTRNYVQSHGEDLYRRSVYTFWKRQAAPASMEIFNAPSRETCTVRRDRTDTPLQALVTLNDPQFVEAARNLAQAGILSRLAPLDYFSERLLARSLRPPERAILESSLGALYLHYKAKPQAAEALLALGETKPAAGIAKPLLAAYTMIANELMNLDEVLNK